MKKMVYDLVAVCSKCGKTTKVQVTAETMEDVAFLEALPRVDGTQLCCEAGHVYQGVARLTE